MRLNLISTFIIGAALAAAGCGGSTTPTGGSNTNASNANSITNVNSTDPANSGLATTKKPEPATTNNAPTIAPVVQTYYDALKKKDDALLKSVMSQEFIKSVEGDMKAKTFKDICIHH